MLFGTPKTGTRERSKLMEVELCSLFTNAIINVVLMIIHLKPPEQLVSLCVMRVCVLMSFLTQFQVVRFLFIHSRL